MQLSSTLKKQRLPNGRKNVTLKKQTAPKRTEETAHLRAEMPKSYGSGAPAFCLLRRRSRASGPSSNALAAASRALDTLSFVGPTKALAASVLPDFSHVAFVLSFRKTSLSSGLSFHHLTSGSELDLLWRDFALRNGP